MTEHHPTTLAVGFPALLEAVPGLLAALEDLRDPEATDPDHGVRIHPVVAPAGTALPYVVHQHVTGSGEGHLGGRSHLANALRQVVVWGKTPDDVDALGKLLLDFLDDGARSRGSYAGLVVASTKVVNELQRYEAASDPDELATFGMQYDVRVWYRR